MLYELGMDSFYACEFQAVKQWITAPNLPTPPSPVPYHVVVKMPMQSVVAVILLNLNLAWSQAI